MIVRDTVGLATCADTRRSLRAPSRVEAQATERPYAEFSRRSPMSRTNLDETGAVRGRTVAVTGSNQRQHADHSDTASVSATAGPEIPRKSYTIVRRGREWT